MISEKIEISTGRFFLLSLLFTSIMPGFIISGGGRNFMLRFSFPFETLPDRFRASLEASWREGIPANIMLVVMDYYLVPFGLFLGASPAQIGFLVAIPHLAGSLSQLLAPRLIRFYGSRLDFLIRGALFQALILIPVAFLALGPFPGNLYLLMFLAALFRIAGNLIGTAWGSLISEQLPAHLRGNYLGWRSRVAGIAGVLGLACAGFLLDLSRSFYLGFGFFILFLSIAGCRFLSAMLFRHMTDLEFHEKKESHFTFLMFLKRFRESNFVKFVLYAASITFATQLASPYFSVYMLRDLKMSYLLYISIHLASVIAGLISFPLWGHHADRVGNARVIKATSLVIPWIPLLWLAGSHPLYLVGIELLAGFIWGGFTLCTANYIYDAVSPGKRVRCLSYFNLITGLAIFAGSSAGGLLAQHLPALFGHKLLTLFALSGGLRFLCLFFLSGSFREVRSSVEPATSAELYFSVLGVRPMTGRDREWNILGGQMEKRNEQP